MGDWGEIETPWKAANCIVRARGAGALETTAQLVEAVKPCTPRKDEAKFLTKLFQALRIEVNGEVEKDFFGRALTPFEPVTRKAVAPSAEELARNPRSRSAKLRAAVKKQAEPAKTGM